MNHLDEGTIHAWLDGALDSAQAADAESHVATCSSCAEAVAEARGIMAAASRIMRALDDDRANVIPKPSASPDVVPISVVSAKRPVRRTAPWVFGVAAVLLAAVVLRTTDMSKDRVASESASSLKVAANPMDSAMAPPPPMAAAPAVPRLENERGADAAQQRVANAARSRTTSRQRDMQAQAAAPAPAPQDMRRQIAVGSVAGGAAATTQRRSAPAPDSTRLRTVPTSVAAADIQTDTARLRRADGANVSFGEQPPSLRSAIVTSTSLTPTERLAGCYRLDQVMASGDAAKAVAEAQTTQSRGARAAAASRAPSAARSEFSDVRAPSLIRLDTSAATLGLAVLRLPGDSAVGAWRVLRDSALVSLGTRGTVMLSVTQKVSCPEP